MIIPTDDKGLEFRASSDTNVPTDDPPPTYSQQSQPTSEASTISPPAVKPSNYVSISRSNGPVKGTWVIDASLGIPASLLPPLAHGETEEDRKNFSVESRNGAVDVDISIASLKPSAVSKKTARRLTIYAKSSNGSVTTKLHASNSLRLPVYLDAYASNGSIHVHLPRSFRGLIVIKTHNGSPKFSAETTTHLMTFSEIDKTRRCFLGDYSEWSDGEQWAGDEVTVEARNGSVKVQFDDEAVESAKTKVPGFLGRLFGL